ncbi:MAG TPA: hypothetical protein VGP61_09850 [Gemmatimonadales bacterium]|nr:hypothetical protein [Gemmatimonadales bacterium]
MAVICVIWGSAVPLAAQSSQFGARGFGIPLRPLSVRATATGSAFGLFDGESALNPASIALAGYLTASFQTVQNWRTFENPAGTGSARDNRYPGLFVSGPLGGTRLALSLSASGYTDRNFTLASRDTLILRGEPVEVQDTLSSQGGISDLRAALAWRQSRAVQWGLGLHLLTGSNRIRSHRAFSDTAFAGATEVNTISYLGFGLSAGVVARLRKVLSFAAMARVDDRMRLQRDTLGTGSVKLPMTLSGGLRAQLGERLLVAGSALFRNWSVSDADLVAQGGVGSVNTTELATGLEFLTDPKRPQHRPLRFGLFHAQLPFSLVRGEALSETGVSLGSSQRFVANRAGVDLSLARVWRKGGANFRERAFLLTLGVSIRP